MPILLYGPAIPTLFGGRVPERRWVLSFFQLLTGMGTRFLEFDRLAGVLCLALSLGAQVPSVDASRVSAHERFLSSDALQGRGSATRDEQIAAEYVGSQFESYHLKPAPGMTGFVQTIDLVRPQLDGRATLTGPDVSLTEPRDFRVLATTGEPVTGTLVRVPANSVDKAEVKKGEAVVLDFHDVSAAKVFRTVTRLHRAGADLMLLDGGEALEKQLGGMPDAIRSRFADGTQAQIGMDLGTVILLKPEAGKLLEAIKTRATIKLSVTPVEGAKSATYNAVGFLPGWDKSAGTLLISAHLDHLGVASPVNGDSIYNGADDDASGTTAVLELARVLAAGSRLRRSILFACFGSEELGGYGDTWFVHHSPVALGQIVANLEFEMIGAQDPKLPKGTLLLTGWERSNLGPTLRLHGAKLGRDPYPEQHFFERSDNYALAKRGIIAHTVAGYGTPPYYHQPNDDFSHLDIAFMTSAIQSFVNPLRWLANTSFRPQWNPGGKP